jgi:hypothetical protein
VVLWPYLLTKGESMGEEEEERRRRRRKYGRGGEGG